MLFNHSGNLGDIVFSLHFCKEFAHVKQEKTFDINIQTNIKATYSNPHPYGNVRMTQESAEMLKPLLLYQDYINEVSISNEVPENCYNLDLFRNLKLNFSAGDIRSWYYNLSTFHLPRKFETKILYAPVDNTFKNKIIIVNTQRYQNIYIDYRCLETFKEHFVFCGTEKEHNLFQTKSCFECEYVKIKDFLEFASIAEGSIGVVGNPSGLYSIAECLKCPRILISPEFVNNRQRGPVNTHPSGGWNEAASNNSKLISSIKNLLEG